MYWEVDNTPGYGFVYDSAYPDNTTGYGVDNDSAYPDNTTGYGVDNDSAYPDNTTDYGVDNGCVGTPLAIHSNSWDGHSSRRTSHKTDIP